MIKTTLTDASRIPFNLEGYILHSSPKIEVIHLCLQPGQVVDLHSNPFDVVACVVNGEVLLRVGDSKVTLSLYDVAEVEAHVERGFTNNGPSEARLIIIKKY